MSEFIHALTSLWALWILLISALIYIAFRPLYRNLTGEKNIKTILSSLPKDKYIVLSNLLLQNVRGPEKIDYLIVSVYGIIILSAGNMTGWIEADEEKETWTIHSYGSITEFKNPILVGKGQERAVRELLGNDKPKVLSVAAFANTCRFKYKGNRANIVHYSSLKKHLLKVLPDAVIPFSEAERLSQQILANTTSAEIKGKSIADIHKKLEERGISAFDGKDPE